MLTEENKQELIQIIRNGLNTIQHTNGKLNKAKIFIQLFNTTYNHPNFIDFLEIHSYFYNTFIIKLSEIYNEIPSELENEKDCIYNKYCSDEYINLCIYLNKKEYSMIYYELLDKLIKNETNQQKINILVEKKEIILTGLIDQIDDLVNENSYIEVNQIDKNINLLIDITNSNYLTDNTNNKIKSFLLNQEKIKQIFLDLIKLNDSYNWEKMFIFKKDKNKILESYVQQMFNNINEYLKSIDFNEQITYKRGIYDKINKFMKICIFSSIIYNIYSTEIDNKILKYWYKYKDIFFLVLTNDHIYDSYIKFITEFLDSNLILRLYEDNYFKQDINDIITSLHYYIKYEHTKYRPLSDNEINNILKKINKIPNIQQYIDDHILLYV